MIVAPVASKTASPATPPLYRDILCFVIFALLGSAASYLSINIPHTDVYVDCRWIFGLIGIALIRRTWLAFLLVLPLSLAGFHKVDYLTALLANLLYAIPFAALARLTWKRLLAHACHPLIFAAGWWLMVLAGYELLTTPVIWAVMGYLNERPIPAMILEGYAKQSFLAEAIFVGLISALGLTAIRIHSTLRASQHYLATTLDSIGDGVITTDCDGRVVRMNPVAESLTGWRTEEAAGQRLEDVFHLCNSQTGALQENPVARVLREGVVVGLANHTCLTARDGTVRQIADSAAPIRDAGQAIQGVVMVFRDVTEDYARREALRESEERLQLLSEATDVALIIHRQGEILEANQRYLDMFGFEREEIDSLGKDAFELTLAPDQIERVRALVDQGERTYETRGRRKDGSVFPLQVCAHTVTYQGEPARAAAFIDLSEQKEAAAQIELQKLVLDQIQDMATITDLEGNILYVNEAICAFYRRSREELLGKHVRIFGNLPNQPISQQELIDATIKTGVWSGEIIDAFPDGRMFALLFRTQLIRGETGEPVALCGIATDITNVKLAEDALRVSEARYRKLFEGSLDGIVFIDRKGHFVDCNQSYMEMLGYTKDELQQMDFYQITPAKWHDWERKHIVEDQLLTRGYSDTYQKEYIRKDGTVFPVELTSYRIDPMHGQPEMLFGVVRDITERKRALEELQESEERWQYALEGAGAGVWDWDIPAGSVYYSRRYKAMLGYAANEFANTFDAWKDRVHPDDRAHCLETLQRHLDGQTPDFQCEHRIRCKDGTYRWVLGRGKIMHRAKDGTPLRAIGTMSDITEQRQMAERLRQSEKLEAIGQLAGGIAHDFNNQLAGIMGYAEIMLLRTKNETLREYANSIVATAQRAADLTEQLLAFARKGQYRFVAVDLHHTVNEVVSMLKHTIDRRIRIVQHFNAETGMTLGDPTQLQNALLNLGLNARDAMPEGGELTFTTDDVRLDAAYCRNHSLEVPPGDYVEVSVIDTGIGMPEAIRRRIFEPFFTTKQEGRGTGMGLAAVYGTVKNHKGAITVCSDPGTGSRFSLYLPARACVQEPEPESTATTAATTARILLVDDEDTVRTATAELLRSAGYEVIACENGREAVEIFRQDPDAIDLVILDMVMPEMGGRETFIAMREIDPGVTALLASGFSINGEAQAILDEGVRGFLQKPFRQAVLLKEIERVLQDLS